jgi:hypothetical protein
MSIEALTLKRFSTYSDVWAFGVYIWELLRYRSLFSIAYRFSYAEVPWDAENVANTDVRQALVDGRRLACPEVRFNDVWIANSLVYSRRLVCG